MTMPTSPSSSVDTTTLEIGSGEALTIARTDALAEWLDRASTAPRASSTGSGAA